VSLDIANQKLKGLSKKNPKYFVDKQADLLVRPLYVEFRKEYIEFFVSFFDTDEEINDEMRLQAIDEYEKLQGMFKVSQTDTNQDKDTENIIINV